MDSYPAPRRPASARTAATVAAATAVPAAAVPAAAPPAAPPAPASKNPNYVPATLNGIVMTLYHESISGLEEPYGAVSVQEGEQPTLPARSSTVVRAQVIEVI